MSDCCSDECDPVRHFQQRPQPSPGVLECCRPAARCPPDSCNICKPFSCIDTQFRQNTQLIMTLIYFKGNRLGLCSSMLSPMWGGCAGIGQQGYDTICHSIGHFDLELHPQYPLSGMFQAGRRYERFWKPRLSSGWTQLYWSRLGWAWLMRAWARA